MAKLIFFTGTSLDGFIAGESDTLDWSLPSEEISLFINDLHRPIGTYLYGRKNYETMVVWETPEVIPDLTPAMMEFGQIWRAADKIVYSRTLEAAQTARTRLEREFLPQAVRDLKVRSPHDISVAGPNLATRAIGAGLVDEIHLLVVPFILGRGKRVLPGNAAIKFDLLEERRFENGWVYLRYQTWA